jgi:hypothetical protein
MAFAGRFENFLTLLRCSCIFESIGSTPVLGGDSKGARKLSTTGSESISVHAGWVCKQSSLDIFGYAFQILFGLGDSMAVTSRDNLQSWPFLKPTSWGAYVFSETFLRIYSADMTQYRSPLFWMERGSRSVYIFSDQGHFFFTRIGIFWFEIPGACNPSKCLVNYCHILREWYQQ